MIRLPGIPALLHLIGQGLKHREEDDMENCSYVIWKKRGDERI